MAGPTTTQAIMILYEDLIENIFLCWQLHIL